MKKHVIVAFVLGLAVVIGSSQMTQALPDRETLVRSSDDTVETIEDRGSSIERDTEEDTRTETEAKRQAIEQKIAEKRAAIAEKLSGQREEKCESREGRINSMLDTRISSAQRHFDTFKAIQVKLEEFTTKRQLTLDGEGALRTIMNDMQTGAQAAISAVEAVDFTCEDASAASPGGIIKEQVATAKQALKDYRDAIKDYAVAVKAAVEREKELETTTEETAQ